MADQQSCTKLYNCLGTMASTGSMTTLDVVHSSCWIEFGERREQLEQQQHQLLDKTWPTMVEQAEQKSTFLDRTLE